MAFDTTYVRTMCENYPHNRDFKESEAAIDKGVVVSDVIADLLHLTVELGLDPEEIMERARGYLEADTEQPIDEPSQVN